MTYSHTKIARSLVLAMFLAMAHMLSFQNTQRTPCIPFPHISGSYITAIRNYSFYNLHFDLQVKTNEEHPCIGFLTSNELKKITGKFNSQYVITRKCCTELLFFAMFCMMMLLILFQYLPLRFFLICRQICINKIGRPLFKASVTYKGSKANFRDVVRKLCHLRQALHFSNKQMVTFSECRAKLLKV